MIDLARKTIDSPDTDEEGLRRFVDALKDARVRLSVESFQPMQDKPEPDSAPDHEDESK